MPEANPQQPLVLEANSDGVATLTLNRPDRLNALDPALGHALIEALHHAAEDNEVRAVVLTGAGRGFCAGGDLHVLRTAREGGDAGQIERMLQTGKQIILGIASMPKPVIAAINGPAAGAGVNLALACGLRLASDRATFTQSFAKIGLFPDFGGTFLLPRLVGPTLAARLLYTGDTITADEALRAGMITSVVPNDSLPEEAAQWGRRLAAAAPVVVRGLKQVVFGANRPALERALDEEIRWQMVCFRSEDSREGLQAFFESGPHTFAVSEGTGLTQRWSPPLWYDLRVMSLAEKIALQQGDLTEMAVDAIVNAANNDLQLGGGLAGVIRRKGGDAIQRECNEIGAVPVGGAAITSGGKLKARYIIHAASMQLGGHTTARALRTSTAHSLRIAAEKGLHTVAFPAIGTGIGGFPLSECADIMLHEVVEHLKTPTPLEKVYVVLFDAKALGTFERVLGEMGERGELEVDAPAQKQS